MSLRDIAQLSIVNLLSIRTFSFLKISSDRLGQYTKDGSAIMIVRLVSMVEIVKSLRGGDLLNVCPVVVVVLELIVRYESDSVHLRGVSTVEFILVCRNS